MLLTKQLKNLWGYNVTYYLGMDLNIQSSNNLIKGFIQKKSYRFKFHYVKNKQIIIKYVLIRCDHLHKSYNTIYKDDNEIRNT